jgi:hypothetical protein
VIRSRIVTLTTLRAATTAVAATALLAAAAAIALVAPASPAIAEAAHEKFFGGVVADIAAGSHVHVAPLARIANLPYGGGSVLHSNRTHVIFWQPDGSGLTYDPGYQAQVETFLSRVAADSRRPTNVYGLSGQYHDSGGPAAYNSRYAGAVLATDRLPADGCSEPPQTGPGWHFCQNDFQLQQEIEHVIDADQLAATPRDIYFLVLPAGLGTCEAYGPSYCALGGTKTGFCGYHSFTTEQRALYAVIPYNAVSGHCQSDHPRPNSSPADPALSTLSHEHNETVTDPYGDAWIDRSDNEDGDLCIKSFGPDLGGSGPAAWDQVIHGGHYYLQDEWSNEDGSCRPRDERDPISFAAKSRVSTWTPTRFAAHAGDPDGSIVAYDWTFGDGGHSHGRVATHRLSHPGSYRVVLRTTDSSGNWAFSARTITVVQAPAGDRRRRHR